MLLLLQRAVTGEPVSNEGRTEEMGVGRLLNPGVLDYPQNIVPAASSKKSKVRRRKQKKETTIPSTS